MSEDAQAAAHRREAEGARAAARPRDAGTVPTVTRSREDMAAAARSRDAEDAQALTRALRLAVVGVSESATCGVRDHATLLAEALPDEGVQCSLHWLARTPAGYRASAREVGGWAHRLAAELAAAEAEVVLLHYSVFSYSYRGMPTFVRPVTRALRRSGLPVVAFVHEPAYPWHLGGARGKVWALSQRALLVDLIRASAGIVVTAPFRAEWLSSRLWLPRRQIEFAPVFPNLPPSTAVPPPRDGRPPTIGLFGYGYEGAAASLVLEALAKLHGEGLAARLELLGAPGPGSVAAESWLRGAREARVADAISFSGVLAPQQLSDAIASCDALLHIEPSGPTSRKGTLAASLASGRPVVAFDGPLRWQTLSESGALAVVEARSRDLADALVRLLRDPVEAERLGGEGQAFAAREMSAAHSAEVTAALLKGVAGSSP